MVPPGDAPHLAMLNVTRCVRPGKMSSACLLCPRSQFAVSLCFARRIGVRKSGFSDPDEMLPWTEVAIPSREARDSISVKVIGRRSLRRDHQSSSRFFSQLLRVKRRLVSDEFVTVTGFV